MFIKKSIFKKLVENIDNLNFVLTKNNLIDLAEILGNRKEMLIRNLIAGIAKGIGIGIGFTILTAILDIVDIVENNRR